MPRSVKLVGLDCGTTTTSCVVAKAALTTGALGKVELTNVESVFRSEVVFTPLRGEQIDETRLAGYLDVWLAAADTRSEEIFGGGALVTGLAAQRENAAAITALVETRMAQALIAAADHPRLESWLAFMGNCHALSQAQPGRAILNLDIGGGTTNLAVGLAGNVLATGCWFVGARHFEFVPGSYRVTRLSRYAVAVAKHLGVEARVGDELSPVTVEKIVDFYVGLLEAMVSPTDASEADEIESLVQVRLQMPAELGSPPSVTLSGGVGQLVYERLTGRPAGGISQFGDLGGELAERIARSSLLIERMGTLPPEGLGRATVFGLLRHSTELSGSTIYLPRPERLPLANVPIVGRVSAASSDQQLLESLRLAAQSSAACWQIELGGEAAEVQDLAARVGRMLDQQPLADGQTLVLLVPGNVGQVLGNYITQWGTRKLDLIVVDEVNVRDAQFVRLGRLREGVVPLWLYSAR